MIFRWFGNRNGPTVNQGLQLTQPGTFTRSTAAPVTFDTAMSVSAFWACCRLLSETVAAMPLKCYKIEGDTKREFTEDKLWKLLRYQPNQYQTSVEFFECMMLNLVSSGNAYAAIERNTRGEIIGLLPKMSAQMQPDLLDSGDMVYTYYTANGNTQVYSPKSIWHVKLFGNGLVGMSPMDYARNSLGIAIATGDRASTLAASGGKTNGILMIDKVLTPEQRKAVRNNFKGLTEGKTDELFVLEADMKFERTSLSPQDMQLLETRRFQIEDICRFMGVPSVLVNDTSGTTAWGSGIQQIMEGFYKLNLRPYLERFESSIMRHLVPNKEWGKIEYQFDFDALLRADQKTRAEARRADINAGTLTPNEGRAQEGRPPKEGGDTIYLNGSLVPAGTPRGDNANQILHLAD